MQGRNLFQFIVFDNLWIVIFNRFILVGLLVVQYILSDNCIQVFHSEKYVFLYLV